MSTACGAHDGLRLGCSIFLSHSGADKDFVRFLYEALMSRGYHVFYDEDSLPKAVQISMKNILAELKDVKLAVVVLSKAFCKRTQHPMNELATIVAAKIQMLPIFYEFSVDQFKLMCRNQAWLKKWRSWVDQKLISEDTVRKWEDAFKVVSGTNGLEYCKEATNLLQLRNKIVARVCQILKPDLPWSVKGLQGMDRLCQIVSERFTDMAESLQQTSMKSTDDVGLESVLKQTMVVGMHGIAGIGKSSLCTTLCDFFFKEFNSRVCYIELGDHCEIAVRKRLESVLAWLTCSTAPMQHLSVQQLWNLLTNHIQGCGSWPVFLAIDNVQVGPSKDEAETYLGCGPFPNGSKIFITAQSADVLASLTSQNVSCSWLHSFPHLSFSDARKIFLHKLNPTGHTILSQQQEYVVDGCVKLCTLNKLQSDYYPLMLVVLASYMRQTSQDPLQWQGKLEELKRDGIFVSARTHIDKLERIFKRVYDSLTEDQQHMLIDLALYLPDALNRSSTTEDAKNCWLDYAYPNQDVDRILSQIVDLSLVQSRDMSVIHSDKCFRVHDLLREFVKEELARNSCSCIFKEHQTVKPSWRPLIRRRRIERLGISNCQFEDPRLDLSGFKEIEVLHLIDNKGLECVRLSKTAWSSLQSLVVQTYTYMNISVVKAAMELQSFYLQLQNCGFLSEARDPSCSLQNYLNSGLKCGNLGYLNLENVRMCEQIGLCLEELPQLHVLRLADLPDLRTNLKFDRCRSIRKIRLENLPNLEAISGLENSLDVAALDIRRCDALCFLVLLDNSAIYSIYDCKALESIEVRQSQLENGEVAVGSLSVDGCPIVSNIIGLPGRRFIGTVSYEMGKRYFLPEQSQLECSPERLERIFENSENSIEQEVRTGNIVQFQLKNEGLEQFVLKDAQDLSSYMSALACTSASSLKFLHIWCTKDSDCGCHRLIHQPRFDYFKMALMSLSYTCGSVRDLSSLENCSFMKHLHLMGCESAVEWPDFGKMIFLEKLIMFSPGQLVYWPCGLRSHPSLDDLIMSGSNQIPPEKLLKLVTSMDPESHSRRDRLSSFAALELLVDDVYSSRKDNLCIAEALMSNSEKLLSIIDKMLSSSCLGGNEEDEAEVEHVLVSEHIEEELKVRAFDKSLQVTNVKFFHLLSQLLYGLWVETDCTLHECTPTCETEGSQMQLLQDCLQGLLSSKTMISALLLTIPEGDDLWREPENWKRAKRWPEMKCFPCKLFRSCYAYESLVLVCFASIEKFKVPLEEEPELVNEIKHIVDSFFERWKQNEYRRLPLLLWDTVPESLKASGDDFFWLVEHDLSAVRVADAVCRLGYLSGISKRRRVPIGARGKVSRWALRLSFRLVQPPFMIPDPLLIPLSRLSIQELSLVEGCEDNLDACIAHMYHTYHDMRARSFATKDDHQDNQSVRKQWHHPVGCFCQLRVRLDPGQRDGTGVYEIYANQSGTLFQGFPLDFSVLSMDRVGIRVAD